MGRGTGEVTETEEQEGREGEASSGLPMLRREFGFHPCINGCSVLRSLAPLDNLGKLRLLSV